MKRREDDKFRRFLKKFKNGEISIKEKYPQELKIVEPYTKAVKGEPIWPQIPLYGTVIIPLEPVKEEFFREVHGFGIEDIERLIDFSKETGRIQFALSESPLSYQRMIYLESIFRELSPPCLRRIPPSIFLKKEEEKLLFNKLLSSLPQNIQEILQRYIKLKYDVQILEGIEKQVISSIITDGIRLRIAGYPDEIFKDFFKTSLCYFRSITYY